MGESFEMGGCGYGCSWLAKGGLDHEVPLNPLLVLRGPSGLLAEP